MLDRKIPLKQRYATGEWVDNNDDWGIGTPTIFAWIIISWMFPVIPLIIFVYGAFKLEKIERAKRLARLEALETTPEHMEVIKQRQINEIQKAMDRLDVLIAEEEDRMRKEGRL